MGKKSQIKVYDTKTFTSEFMPSKELDVLLKEGMGKFFIVRVEDMYQHVKGIIPPSRSVTYSCLYLTEGVANMKIGSESYKIHADEILFVPAGQVFSFQDGDVNKGYICNFHDDILIGKFGKSDLLKDFDFLRVWGNPLIKLDEQSAVFVRHLFMRLLIDYSQNGIQNLDIIQSYLITLLCEVSKAYKPDIQEGSSSSITICRQFRELLFSKIKIKHLVSDYAAMLSITPNHLNKVVKTTTGKSPGKWIDEAIVLEAKVLLSQSNMTISELAVELGMDDQSYFTRLFRKYEGITPTAFRQMIEKS